MAGNGIQVLIVDDNTEMRNGYAELLSRWGFATRTAQNGVAALIEIRRAKPNILLLELDVPVMNGYELLPIARRLCPEMPIVAMSGARPCDTVPSAVAADAFYTKGTGRVWRLRAILGALCTNPDSTVQRADIARGSV